VSLLDAHPTPKPGAYWPDGFRERAQAAADKVAAERHGCPRLIKTGSGYADHIGDAIAGYEPTPEIVPEELGARPARVARVREDDEPKPVFISDQQRARARILMALAGVICAQR